MKRAKMKTQEKTFKAQFITFQSQDCPLDKTSENHRQFLADENENACFRTAKKKTKRICIHRRLEKVKQKSILKLAENCLPWKSISLSFICSTTNKY